jgi:UDP-N-acetylmuramate dehydrogenase
MFDSKIQQNIPLAPLTTFKIGGPAKYFVKIETKEELAAAFDWARENKEPVFILAGGSNVLINDKGADGLVVKICNSGIKVMGQRLDCGAGAGLMAAARMAISENLTGLEWAIGIPGTVGGAVRGNAEAFSSPMSNIVETVELFNIQKKRFEIFSNKECKFTYRHSFFKENSDYLIWNVVLKMTRGNAHKIKNLIEKNLRFRSKANPKLPNAGSIFKNIPLAYLSKINVNLADEAAEVSDIRNGNVGSGWIIDKLGVKGKTIGGAKVSLEHANFIVNTGKATAEDVIMLISFIKQQARDKFGAQLREEIEYLGF